MNRPKVTDEIILEAAKQVAVAIDGNAEDIAQHYVHPMDGYELAKELEYRCSWDIERSDIEILDDMEWIVSELLETAEKQWVIDNDIKPKLEVGAKTKRGTICGVSNHSAACYLVKENGCTHEGRYLLVKFEDAEANIIDATK